jgi:hypothetical protein
MEDPSNLAVLDDLGFLTGMEIHPVMIGPTELGEAIDRYYLTGAARQRNRPAESNETLGERNLRSLSEEAPHQAVAPPPSRDVQLDLDAPSSALPEGLLEDVANALEDSQKTRVVARAIVQLLIEKGIVTLEEVQVQVARQRGSRTE